MLGMGLPELILIGIIVIVVFGPDKLPEVAKGIGKTLGELKKHSDAARKELYNVLYPPAVEEFKKDVHNELRSLSTNDSEYQCESAQKEANCEEEYEEDSCQVGSCEESDEFEEDETTCEDADNKDDLDPNDEQQKSE